MGASIRTVYQVTIWLVLLALAPALAPQASAQRQLTRSPHGPLTIPCENCHTSTSWAPIRAIPEFNHDKTRYALRGMHEKVPCTGCHQQPVFTNVGKNCADCHADIHRRQNGANCEQCHTVLGWNVAVQAMQQHFNRFPLLGAHAVVQCEQCHVNAAAGQYMGLSTACESCHMKDYQNTTNPAHAKAGSAFAASNCSTCHMFDSWLNANFNHASTGFLLTEGHANVACPLCHINNNYSLTIAPNDCGNSGCHLTTWMQTTNPVHPSAGAAFAASQCSTCHTPANWTTANFNHSSVGFPLTNGHANVPCTSCHLNNNYNLTIAANDCGNAICHLTTWQQTNNPVHSTSGSAFAAANCATCHTTAGWSGAAFDHSVTGFALVGTHLSTPCASCHVNNNYTLNSADCYGCHQAAFQSTTSIGGAVPNHVTAGFPTTASACASCHPITTWSAGVFNHAATGFPLTNGHANVACNLCHINNNYSLTTAATDCGNSNCHLTTWQTTNNPVHSTSGSAFAAANCSTCHTTVGWDAASFDHSVTGFALVGTHLSTPCASCHVNNNYTLSSADCYGCHSAVFQGTATIGGSVPNHVTAGFPTTASACASCHPITTWSAGVFNHSSTGFPLTNSHATAACNLCHINNNYALSIAPTDCGNSGCHLNTNYGGGWQGTTNPPHSAAGPLFAVANCATCHTTVSFTTATFDHSTTGWALTGMHVSPPALCSACHIGNNYSITSTACYGCHTAEWQSTATLGGTVPNHITGGFPTDCSICHSTSNWTTSSFNHSTTVFPLLGAHISVPCANCHVGGNFTTVPTTCVPCHQPEYNSTATMGGGIPNHVASSYPTTCLNCHNMTNWLNAVFDHSKTAFPLTGAHITVACNLCHISSAPPPTDCYSCHTAQWQSTATLGGSVPNHLASDASVAGIVPTACATCHNTTAWTGATFTHSWWSPTHGGANNVCATCHTNSTGAGASYVIFVCSNGACHTRPGVDNHHQGNSSYVWSSGTTCYACHKNGGG